jgi:WD40 repeat protein
MKNRFKFRIAIVFCLVLIAYDVSAQDKPIRRSSVLSAVTNIFFTNSFEVSPNLRQIVIPEFGEEFIARVTPWYDGIPFNIDKYIDKDGGSAFWIYEKTISQGHPIIRPFTGETPFAGGTAGVGIHYSPDGNHLAIKGYDQKIKRGYVVIDGQDGPHYDEVKDFVFSPNSRRFAYWARQGKKWTVVFDGKEGASYDYSPEKIIFSPDSEHSAYVVYLDKELSAVVLDGIEQKSYPFIAPSSLSFSPDSKHFCYFAGPELSKGRGLGTVFLVMDGKEQAINYDYYAYALQSRDLLFRPVFSPDSQTIAFYALKKGINSKTPKEMVLVVNGIETSSWYAFVEMPLFSPDSRRIGYCGYKTKRDFKNAVYDKDGERIIGGGFAMWTSAEFPMISPDGKRSAYRAYDDDSKSWIVSDGEAGPKYDNVTIPVFSPDGKLLIYGALESGYWSIIVNGQKGKTMYRALIGTGWYSPSEGIAKVLKNGTRAMPLTPFICFDSPGSWHFLALTELGLFMVDEKIIPEVDIR